VIATKVYFRMRPGPNYSQMVDADRRVVETVAAVAAEKGVPRAQVALAWVLQKPDDRLEQMARAVVAAMDGAGARRLIWISSMGIYDEVPGQRYGSILDPYRDSAAIIEASDLDYTILRPAWFTDDDEVNYETTQKGEPFRGRVISRKSVAALVVKLAESPGLEVRRSLGVSKPGR
jgi:uncharacterized protein YbjT (DUF2867 family)